MLDLFFRVLVQTGSSEDAYDAVAREIKKRRLEVDGGEMDYEEACRVFMRVVEVTDEVERIRGVFEKDGGV